MQASSAWESHSNQISTGRENYFNGEIGLNYEPDEHQSLGVRYAPEQHIGEYRNSFISSTEMYRDGVLVDQLETEAQNTGKKGLEHSVNAYYTGTFGKWNIDFNADFYQGRHRNRQLVCNNGENDAASTNQIKNRLYATKLIATTTLWKGNLSFGTEEIWTDRWDRFEQNGFSANADDHIRQDIVLSSLIMYWNWVHSACRPDYDMNIRRHITTRLAFCNRHKALITIISCLWLLSSIKKETGMPV